LLKKCAADYGVGMKALEKSLAYVEQQPNATVSDVLLIKMWRDIAARNRGNMLKQTLLQITTYQI
jgi:hypothetical protein